MTSSPTSLTSPTSKVSVIIPTYHGEAFVSRTILSVLEQRHVRFEVIVCDDGSTDDTLRRVAEFGDRLTVLRQANQGVAAARMHGVGAASGDYLAFLDQDDLYEPDFLARQLALLLARPELGLVYSDSWIIDRRDEIRGRRSEYLRYQEGRVFGSLLAANFIPTETMLLPRRVFEAVGGFRSEFHYLEDWDLCLRIAHRYPVGFCPEPLARYRIHGGNLSYHKEPILSEWAIILEQWIDGGTLTSAELEIARSGRSLRHGELALEALKRGDRAAARQRLEACESLPARLRLQLALISTAQHLLPEPAFKRLLRIIPRRPLYGVEVEQAAAEPAAPAAETTLPEAPASVLSADREVPQR